MCLLAMCGVCVCVCVCVCVRERESMLCVVVGLQKLMTQQWNLQIVRVRRSLSFY